MEEVLGHEFRPEIDDQPEDAIIVAACECGWSGGGSARSEGGYDEAKHEHAEHLLELELGDQDEDDRR